MKIISKLLSICLLILLVGTACKDETSVELDPIKSGNADFSKYVAVGNSLTAGYQSSALYESAQEYSFPNLIARQLRIDDFQQPLISDPGIGGRLGLDGGLSTFSPVDQANWGSPINATLSRPYDNLGIPGAILADFTGTDIPGAPYSARKANNPFFGAVLRTLGDTQAEQLANLNPTLITFWLGNNDVLGYVTSGGVTPYLPASAFDNLYQASGAQLAATGANTVVYNIPNVSTVPFVFYVNQSLMLDGTFTVRNDGKFGIDAVPGDPSIWVEITDPSQPGVVTDTVEMKAHIPSQGQVGDFFLLTASTYLSQNVLLAATNRTSPIPNQYVLDAGELTQASQLVAQYNSSISTVANNNDFILIDINQKFSDIITEFQASGGTGGYTANGITLRPVPGEIFSLDAVHPSNRGYAVVANWTIQAMNDIWGSDIPEIDLRTIPRGVPVTDPQ
jgi:lysophospholipase L1-like esterase